MSVSEELDTLAADGRVTNVTLGRRHGGGWQCYLTMGATGGHLAQIGDTPSAALAKAIEKLPATEAYDMKYGAAAVSERAKAEQQADVAGKDWIGHPALTETQGVAGIFD